MAQPAAEFEISANELRLVYRPRDDTSWVRERFERGDGLVVKGTFHLTPQDLVAEAAEAAPSGDDNGDIPWVDDDRLVFTVAIADGEYFRFKPEVLGFETPVCTGMRGPIGNGSAQNARCPSSPSSRASVSSASSSAAQNRTPSRPRSTSG
jgi:hypothetical protein